MAFIAPIIAAAAAGGGTALAGGTLATSLAVGSAALTGLAGLQSGLYQSEVAKQNARTAQENAERASLAGQREEIRAARETSQLLGQQEAIQGASGLDILGRSAVLTRRAAQRVGREEALDIREAGQGEARGFLQQAANFRGEAKQATAQGIFSAAEGALSAASALSKPGATKRKPSLAGGARSSSSRFYNG